MIGDIHCRTVLAGASASVAAIPCAGYSHKPPASAADAKPIWPMRTWDKG